ncbi:MAG TPA: RagB/SusD family nutrient uptake outer membrane protein [Kofleriaceae bacterium]|nr:RagB/SusD family nutrient uptake outer membrane protein [Kofleriaceae bacterium]
MHTKTITAVTLGVLGALVIPACDLDVPDLNNPLLQDLQEHPTSVNIKAATTGLFIGNRRNIAAENGYVDVLGVLGREAYNFDSADPRYVGELLSGELSQGSPYGGNFWALPYANIRLANVILDALDQVPSNDLGDIDKLAIRGFVHTIEATDLLEVIVTHDTNGAVIDTDQPIATPPAIQMLGEIVSRDKVYDEIVRLLDLSASELDQLIAAKAGFPFTFSSGYHNHDGDPDINKFTFDIPVGFRKVNRAIKARVSAYREKYDDVLAALAESFIDDSPTADLKYGAYHVYTAKTGDVTNALNNRNILVHPSVSMEAQTGDARLAKIKDNRDMFGALVTRTNSGLSSSQSFTLYSATTPVAIIRNEELILLKAEALFLKTPSDPDAAATELSLVRTKSGKLGPLGPAPDRATFISQLLYERRYSLLFEGGFRWIDARRFGRTDELAHSAPAESVLNIRLPFPAAECNARPGEPACGFGSTADSPTGS